jgi:small GTP-binding protein
MDFAEGYFRSNFKIVVLGDGGVGKTAIVQNLRGESFSANYLLTIGADITTYSLNHNGQPLNLQIWDLAGQQRFRTVRNLYYGGARGAILVFDLTRQESFYNLTAWKDDLFEFTGRKVPSIILGNKADIESSQFDNYDLVYEFIDELETIYSDEYNRDDFKVPFLETSAKTGQNIPQAFDALGKLLVDYREVIQ